MAADRQISTTLAPVEIGSAIDSITQNEDSKIDYYYVMMMRNNKFEHYGRDRNLNNVPLNYFFSSRFELWNLECNTFHNHTIT